MGEVHSFRHPDKRPDLLTRLLVCEIGSVAHYIFHLDFMYLYHPSQHRESHAGFSTGVKKHSVHL